MSDARGKTTRAGWSLAALYWLVPPFSVAGGLALAPLAALAGLIAAPFRAPTRGAFLGFAAVGGPLLALMVWAFVTQQWSPFERGPQDLAGFFEHPPQGAKLVLGALTGLALVAAAALAGARDRALIRASGAAAVAVLALMLLIESFGMPLNRLANDEPNLGIVMRNPGKGGTILVALLWGAMAGLIGGGALERLLWRSAFVLTGYLSLQFAMESTAVGFAAGAAAFALGWMAPRLMPILVGGGLAIFTFAAPALYGLVATWPGLGGKIPLSWSMRLEIWDYTVARILERPWFGHGLDAARVVTDTVTAGPTTFGGGPAGPVTFYAIPLHPHAMSLHVWYEVGAVGAALLAAMLAGLGVAIARTLGDQPAAAAAATATLASVGLIFNVSFGAWQEWWIATAFAAAALCAAARRTAPPAPVYIESFS